jgi:hypothetical protein
MDPPCPTILLTGRGDLTVMFRARQLERSDARTVVPTEATSGFWT